MVSVSVLVLPLVAIALSIIPGVFGDCPYGWVPYACTNYCVKKFLYEKSWSEARESCRGNDAYLVTITSFAETNFIKGFLRQHYGNNWWTAGHKLRGYWRWDGVTSGRFGYSDWGPGEPNNAGGREYCLTLWYNHGGRWCDDQCFARHYYVCQKSQ